MPDINASYIWAINCCNAPNVGYSRDYRNQQVKNGITYYDCSSFIFYALKAGGFDVAGPAFTEAVGEPYSGNAITTANEGRWLELLGFVRYPFTSDIVGRPGDIVIRSGHTEMVYEATRAGYVRTMGAHSSGFPLDRQVSINETDSNNWSALYRYGEGGSGGTTYQWINGTHGEYFGSPTDPLGGSEAGNEKAKNNAACVLQFFYPRGWTINAIAALCGNMQQESTLNPNSIENPAHPETGGYGLVQWTPQTVLYNILDYLYGSHADWYDGNKQCEAIYTEYRASLGEIPAETGIESGWIPNYPGFDFKSDMTFDEFVHSTQDPGYLANVLMANYERPREWHVERETLARAWYEYLLILDPTPGGGGTVTGKRRFWIYLRYRWR